MEYGLPKRLLAFLISPFLRYSLIIEEEINCLFIILISEYETSILHFLPILIKVSMFPDRFLPNLKSLPVNTCLILRVFR